MSLYPSSVFSQLPTATSDPQHLFYGSKLLVGHSQLQPRSLRVEILSYHLYSGTASTQPLEVLSKCLVNDVKK